MVLHLREVGIGVGVHYIPITHHKFYQESLGVKPGDCPFASEYFEEALSLPLFSNMKDEEVAYVSEKFLEGLEGVRD